MYFISTFLCTKLINSFNFLACIFSLFSGVFDYYDYYNGDYNFQQYNQIDRIGVFDADYYDEEDRTSKDDESDDHDTLLDCEATSTFKNQVGMKKWCNDNCNHVPKNCPKSMCSCKSESSTEETNEEDEHLICKPTNPFKHVIGMTKWCDDNCNGATKFCPETFCTCM